MGPIMASNQQEADIIENWEEIDETELEQKLNQLITPNITLNSSKRSNGDIEQPIKVVLTGEDAFRTQYVPPEPTVTILKRPTKDPQNSSDSKVFQPKKTLQQREQAYAEARLRILGEASPEKVEEKISIQKPRGADLDNVIRLPKGPDGTNGFNARR